MGWLRRVIVCDGYSILEDVRFSGQHEKPEGQGTGYMKFII